MWGTGSRARASSTRWSCPPDSPPMGLSSRSPPWTRSRLRRQRSRYFPGMGRHTGHRAVAAVKKSSTDTGSPRSKLGDWGT